MAKGKGNKKGKKTGKASGNAPPENEDDMSMDQDDTMDPEDLEYFQDSQRSFTFLQELAAEVPSSGKKRKRKQAEDEEEADYEKRPRTASAQQDDNERVLLPIKSKESIIQRKEKLPLTDTSSPIEGKSQEESVPEEAHIISGSPTQPAVSSTCMVELFNQRRQKLIQRKLKIAELSNSILENPEGSVSELRDLCSLCNEKDTDVKITTKKLAVVSLLTVFKDIIPGYPIRKVSEKEQGVKLSKEVKKLREYEEGLLKYYQQYLQMLEETVQECLRHQKPTATNGVVNKKMASKISKLCCNAFVTLFKQDSVGSVSLEAVKVISKFVKSKGFRVQPCILETLLHLRISIIDIQSLKQHSEKKSEVELKIEKNKNRMEKKLKGKMSKKEKKRKREMKKLEKELQETEAVESQQKRAKLQTEILKFVFVTYFRVLKTVGHSPLLSPVLEGLAKFAHLINVDFFNDLMAALHTLLDNKELTLRETLNCVLTAFKILSGQGEALNIDPREFYSMLYLSLLQVHVGRSSQDVPVALHCLEEMLKKRRKQVPIQRVAGFVKRLCTVSLQSQANSALAFLAYVKSFLQSHTKVQALLDSDSMGTGVFRPDVNDPELSNADSTTAWELAVLGARHFHPAFRLVAHHVAEGAPSKGQLS